MKTDVISIYSDLRGRAEAMHEAERFAAYNGLTGKPAKQIRLLTEETISMVDGIVSAFRGDFWLESKKTKDGLRCRICLSANVEVSDGQEDALLGVSTSGKNEDAKGILGKIRQVFRWTIQQNTFDPAVESSPLDVWYEMGTNHDPMMHGSADYWSLQQYRRSVQAKQESAEAWDELEKSIIANLADEVKVGIRSERAQVIIEKCFPDPA